MPNLYRSAHGAPKRSPITRYAPFILVISLVIIMTGAIAYTLAFDPQVNVPAYSYYHNTKNINSNDVSTAIVAYYTRALFFVTAILSVVAVIQIYFLIRADNNARDAMITDQRAFVFASSVRGEWRQDPVTRKFTWVLKPIWRNSGKTPTQRLRVSTYGEIRDRPVSGDADPTRDEGLVGVGFIGPTLESLGGPWPTSNQLTQEDVSDIVAARKFLYLWGSAKYYDVFDRKTEHISRFCWIITAIGDPTKVPKGAPCPAIQWGYIQHQKGNCADDECAA